MKTKFFHLISLLTLMAFAGACGKEVSKGNQGQFANPSIGYGVDQNAYNALKNWANSADNNNNILYMGEIVTKTENATQSNTGGGFSFQWCLFGAGNACQTNNTSPASACFVKDANNALRIGTPGNNNCGNLKVYHKSENAKLAEAMSGNGLTLMRIYNYSGSLFELHYGNVGDYYPKKIFVIDTAQHSMVNPVIIQENGVKTTFLGYRQINY